MRILDKIIKQVHKAVSASKIPAWESSSHEFANWTFFVKCQNEIAQICLQIPHVLTINCF